MQSRLENKGSIPATVLLKFVKFLCILKIIKIEINSFSHVVIMGSISIAYDSSTVMKFPNLHYFWHL